MKQIFYSEKGTVRHEADGFIFVESGYANRYAANEKSCLSCGVSIECCVPNCGGYQGWNIDDMIALSQELIDEQEKLDGKKNEFLETYKCWLKNPESHDGVQNYIPPKKIN